MPTEEELEKKDNDSPEEASLGEVGEEPSSASPSASARPRGTGTRSTADDDANGTALARTDDAEDEEEYEEDAAPAQLGSSRFVYAAYMGGAIAVAFFVSKILDYAWLRLSQWKPLIGEPQEELVMAISGAIGAGAAIYYWRRTRARQLVEEVADELSKVTWPSKQEVTNGTAVVLVTTAVATVFFALMDRFWGFVTNLVYGS